MERYDTSQEKRLEEQANDEQRSRLIHYVGQASASAVLIATALLPGQAHAEAPHETSSVPSSASAPSPAASFNPDAEDRYPRKGWEACDFRMTPEPTNNSCESFYPTVSTDFIFENGILYKNCVFAGLIKWGDGKMSPYRIEANDYPKSDITDPTVVTIGKHTYAKPGRYFITSEQTPGTCPQLKRRYAFDLYQQPTPQNCERKFDTDRGRAYMYSMNPVGHLKRKNGKPLNDYSYDYEKEQANVYVDEAGITWTLLSPLKSIYHQPKNWSYLRQALNPNTVVQAPYKKFVSETDSKEGSFEAVLMPDGVRQGSGLHDPRKAASYNDNNWLLRGPGIATYNLGDPIKAPFTHWMKDVSPHDAEEDLRNEGKDRDDDRYVMPTHWIDPTKTDWKTYRERLEKAQELVANGYKYEARNDKAVLAKGDHRHPVDQAQVRIVKEMSDCAK